MSKIFTYKDHPQHYLFECPGCGYLHVIDERWQFNGDFNKPTFKPSLLVNGRLKPEEITKKNPRCHSFITDGKIKFLSDCTHKLKGQTLEMQEVEENEWRITEKR